MLHAINLRNQTRTELGVTSPCSPAKGSSHLRMPCASGQRIQHERCQWLNSGADQRDRARVLNTHRDMGDIGRGKDRLSWVDHPLSGRHVST